MLNPGRSEIGSSRGPQRRRPDRSPEGRGCQATSLVASSPAQVGVVAADPVLATRREGVEDDRVLEHVHAVRDAAGIRTLSPGPTSRSSSPTTKRSLPDTTVAICSFGCSCSGTTAPAPRVICASVIASPFSIRRPIPAFSCSIGSSSQRRTSTGASLCAPPRSRKLRAWPRDTASSTSTPSSVRGPAGASASCVARSARRRSASTGSSSRQEPRARARRDGVEAGGGDDRPRGRRHADDRR